MAVRLRSTDTHEGGEVDGIYNAWWMGALIHGPNVK